MALTPRLGSSTSSSTPNTVPSDIPNTQSDHTAHMPFITDSELNKFAIDTTQYADTTKQLVGFAKGKRVLVTYYNLLSREGTNNRTNIADAPNMRNVLATEYHKILNLEITLPKGFEFTANNDKANVTIKGQAMFYPGMNPNIGDQFLMGTGDGRTGVCRISSVTPMSWRQDRIFLVDFIVPEFVDPTTHDPIEGMVTLTSVFSKANYLGGTKSLLSEQTYLQLEAIKATRSNLCKLYHNMFFDTSINSYLRPDGTYDPHVVQFMANKITMDDVRVRPKNLTGQIPKIYQETLWARLEDRHNATMYNLSPNARSLPYNQTRMGVFVTELFNRRIITPSANYEIGDPYIYSESFYKGLVETMSAEELMVHKAITKRDVGELGVLITLYLDTVFALSKDDQFYKIPLYIHLIDMALESKYREVDAPSMSYASNGDH